MAVIEGEQPSMRDVHDGETIAAWTLAGRLGSLILAHRRVENQSSTYSVLVGLKLYNLIYTRIRTAKGGTSGRKCPFELWYGYA